MSYLFAEPKMLITGGDGQLATALKHHPLAKGFQIATPNRHELDITDPSSIERALKQIQPKIIINTAAYTAVDKAEMEEDKAIQINHQGPKNIAIACAKHNILLIHISTDYIFDGRKTSAYDEEDTPVPINIYGMSKWMGEKAIKNHSAQHIILRVSGIFSEYGHNFFKTILALAKEKKELRIVSDQITCPTAASDIAETIFKIATHPTHFGTYHYCSAKACSWHAFAVSIINEARAVQSFMVDEIKSMKSAEYPASAKRPANSVLNCDKIARDFAIKQPSWEDAMKKLVAKKEQS